MSQYPTVPEKQNIFCSVTNSLAALVLGPTVLDKRPLREINACSAYDHVDQIILQTLMVNATGPIKIQALRTLIDSGSGRSYITTAAVENVGLKSVGTYDNISSFFIRWSYYETPKAFSE